MTLPAGFWIDQGELLAAAIEVGYLAHLEEVVCDLTGEPELVEQTARITGRRNHYTLHSGGPGRVSFAGWDGIEIVALYDNPTCLGCGEATDRKDFLRCRPCTVKARPERKAVA